jgi:hypothetical protein
MKRLYRWKRGQLGLKPAGVEIDKCYTLALGDYGGVGDEPAHDLLDENGRVVAREIPLNCLEECTDQLSAH